MAGHFNIFGGMFIVGNLYGKFSVGKGKSTVRSRQKILVNNYQVLDARMMTVISSKAAKWSCAYLQNIICKANLRIPRGYIPVSHASASQKENI